jgi:O-antigen ligase
LLPRPLLAVTIALLSLVPFAAFMVNGVVLSLAILAIGAPAIIHWPRWFRLRTLGFLPIAIGVLLLWMAISAPWALDPGEAGAKSLRLVGLFFLALLAIATVDCAPNDQVARMAQLLVYAMIGLVFLVAVEFAAGGVILRQAKDYHRELLVLGLDMTLSQYITWRVQHALTRSAVVLVALGPLALYAMVHFHVKRRIIFGLGAAGLAIVFYLPFTMGQVAILVSALSAGLVWLYPRAWASVMTVVLLSLLMGLPLLALVIDPAHPFGIDAAHLAPGLQHRLQIWHFTAERIAERPWTGWGLESARKIPGGGQVVQIFKDGMPLVDEAVLLPLHPHNVILQIWLEGGAIGAMCIGAIIMGIGQVLERLRPYRQLYCAIVAAVCGLGVLLLTSIGLWQEWVLALIGLTTAFGVVMTRVARA